MRPSVFISAKSGTRSTWSGIIIVARYTPKIAPRPLNGSRLNAYAAVALVTSCTTVVTVARSRLFATTLANGSCEKSCW